MINGHTEQELNEMRLPALRKFAAAQGVKGTSRQAKPTIVKRLIEQAAEATKAEFVNELNNVIALGSAKTRKPRAPRVAKPAVATGERPKLAVPVAFTLADGTEKKAKWATVENAERWLAKAIRAGEVTRAVIDGAVFTPQEVAV